MKPKKLKSEVAATILNRRKELGLTQAQVAQEIGVSDFIISQIERQAIPMPLARWEQFAEVLKLDKAEFLKLVLKEQLPIIAKAIDELYEAKRTLKEGEKDE